MKVCHIISGYFRTDARIFQRQCISLRNDKFEVSILTNDGQEDEEIKGIRIYNCKRNLKSRLAILLFAKWQFKQNAIDIDADIYQLHSPELLPLGRYLKKIGKKVIYDAHEDLPRHIIEKEWLEFFPPILRRLLSIIVEEYMDKTLKLFDETITPHHHVNDMFLIKGINSTLITNFPLVRSYENFSFEEYKLRNNAICYTGTVYSYSHQEEILQSMDGIEGLKYKVAGYFEENHLESLGKHRNFSKLEYFGKIPWERLHEFYSEVTIGLVVYDYKLNLGDRLGSFGSNKLFEYMEAGLPIICTDYDLWKEVVQQYKCGIAVEPRNVAQIHNAIKFFVENKAEAYKYGQNGKEAVEKVFNWKSEERKYLNLFNNIALKK